MPALIVVVYLSIKMYQGHGTMLQPVYPPEMASAAYPYSHQPQVSPLQGIETSDLESQFVNPPSRSVQLAPIYGFSDATSQVMNAAMMWMSKFQIYKLDPFMNAAMI